MRKPNPKQLVHRGGEHLSKQEYAAFKEFNANATAYKKQEHWYEACEEFKKAHLLKPNDVYLLNNIGDMLNKATDFAGAKEYFDSVLGLDPDNAYAKKGLRIANREARKYPSQNISGSSKVSFFGGSSKAKAHESANGKTVFTYNSIQLN